MDIVMLVIVASVYLGQATVVIAKHIKVEESNDFASRKH